MSAPNSSPEKRVKYEMPSQAPTTASRQHSSAVKMHTQAAHGRNRSTPRPEERAKLYMKP